MGRTAAWDGIANLEATPVGRGRRDLADLPPPAQRLLERALPQRGVTVSSVVLDMEGEIKLGRWLPFTAEQILHPAQGFVWNAVVGRPWFRFRGGDTYWQGRGSLDFRLAGLIPVVRASGADIDRSAAGRLAAEAVVWTPQALLPAAGAVWQPIDDTRARVTRQLGDDPFEVTVTVDGEGVLRDLQLERWGNPGGGAFDSHAFGGTVTEIGTFDGTTIAAAGTVGWWWGTDRQADGEFFRYRILRARPVSPAPR